MLRVSTNNVADHNCKKGKGKLKLEVDSETDNVVSGYIRCSCKILSVPNGLSLRCAAFSVECHETISSSPSRSQVPRTKKHKSEAHPSDLPRPRASLPWHTPRLRTHLFSFHKRPGVRPHADAIVDRRVRSLVQQRGAQRGHRVDAEPCLDAAVHAGEGVNEGLERPFPGEG